MCIKFIMKPKVWGTHLKYIQGPSACLKQKVQRHKSKFGNVQTKNSLWQTDFKIDQNKPKAIKEHGKYEQIVEKCNKS